MDKLKINFKDPATLATLGGCLLVIIGSILPAAKVSFMGMSESASLMQSGYNHHGIVHLILAIAIIVVLVIDKKKIVMGLAAAEVIWCINDIRGVASDVNDANKIVKDAASLGIGFWLIVIGAVAFVAAIVLMTLAEKKNAGAPAQQ